ncbi:hypothetical protein SAMN05216221_2347 [Pseudomonas oryzae]|uniref:Uncharacterized protein n=1 Tax=Pseudomonas oryzae TaxID=1392877 RepID=A0A1H1U4X6_9PSED|nr:hypothetical protein SAMN05216221_2347 [Pseudomonas oryzae]
MVPEAGRSPALRHAAMHAGPRCSASPRWARNEHHTQNQDASRPLGTAGACLLCNKCGTGVRVPLDKNNLIHPEGGAPSLPGAGGHEAAGVWVSAATVGAIMSRRLYNNIAWDPPS